MKLTIDKTILAKHNLELEEFLVLCLGIHNSDIKLISRSLISKGFADRDLYTNDKIFISTKTKNLITSMIIESDKNIIDSDDKFTDLAIKLRELYPSGKKEGTTYLWRGTTLEVAKKLKTLTVKYGYSLNPEEVIEATKEYIRSFNGNYRYMQLLKYFILKSVRDADGNIEVKSELMSFIENKDQMDSQREDWVSNMI